MQNTHNFYTSFVFVVTSLKKRFQYRCFPVTFTGLPVSLKTLENPGFFLEPGKPWNTLEFTKNLKKKPWKNLEFILSVIFSFLSLRLESCFIYYPVIYN